MKPQTAFYLSIAIIVLVVGFPTGVTDSGVGFDSLVTQAVAADGKKVVIAQDPMTARSPVAVKARAAKKRQVDLSGLLNNLQKTVTLAKSQPQKGESKQADAHTIRGFKKVDDADNTTVAGEYTIPTADIYLDGSGVGIASPSDSNPQVK